MDRINQDIVRMVERMPAFPKSVQRVLELSSNINSAPRELVAVIEHDPVLVMKILKLVNSAYFGISVKITSVNHAVVHVGFNTVKHLALTAAAMGVLPRKSDAGFDMSAFLLHSLGTATIAKLIARKLHIPAKDEFDHFLAGLLHDFGKIVFAYFMPFEFSRALRIADKRAMPLYEAENTIFKINHTYVGAILGEKWRLPAHIMEPLMKHHDQEGDRLLLADVVSAANEISKELRIGFGGNAVVGKLPDAITKSFGADMQSIVNALGDVNAEVEKMMVFITL